MPDVRCKLYHRPRKQDDPGFVSDTPSKKSRYPGWAADPLLQRLLIEEALVEPSAPADSFGRPKVLWNAVGGTVFIGVSTNEERGGYNCYPSTPVTSLHSQLSKRAERTVDAFLAAGAAQ